MTAIRTLPSAQARPASSLQLVALVGIAATALAFLTTAQAGIALLHEGQVVPWVGLLKARLVDWYACALFMPVLFWLARRFPIERGHWQQRLPILLLAAVPIAIAKEAIYVAVGDYFRPGLFDLGTILSEDLSYEVMAVWAFLAVAQLYVFLARDEEPARSAGEPAGILVSTRSGLQRVPPQAIEYVEAQGNYARLVTATGRYLVRETMSRLEDRLGGEFLRVHRSAIVRRDRVVRVEPASNGGYRIELASGARLRSGRSYREGILASGLAGLRG
ncbi:MAG TPA: LytTR family DNA-binding domain-containing protein [Hyphomonadaceae bacterium]|nr:LytTR family DNA-binding domain-containing protein [Hyphomonadaceae bacterium]